MLLIINLVLFLCFMVNLQVFFIEYHIAVYILLFLTPLIIIFRSNLIIHPIIIINFFWSISSQIPYVIVLELSMYILCFLQFDVSGFNLFKLFWEI